MTARVHQATYTDDLVALETGDLLADTGHPPDDFVTRHDRILFPAPVVTDVVDIGVANAAKQDLDLDVVWTQVAALEGKRHKIRLGRVDGVAVNG
jgi:hypothetical protein